MFTRLISKGGLSFDRLHSFLQVARAGGIARAVGDDPTRQSLVSRQIKELEQFFGVKLTRRSGKGIQMTEPGQRLARLAHEQLLGLTGFANDCAKQELRVTIGAGNSLLEWLVVPRIQRLRRGLNNASIELLNLRTSDVVKELVELRIDFGLMRHDAVHAPLRSVSLGQMRFRLVLPRKLAALKRGADWRWLEQIPLATYQGGVFGATLARDAEQNKLPLRVALACSSFTQALRAAETGEFGAILPDVADAATGQDRFVSLEPPFLREHRRSIDLVWNPRLLKLRDCLVDSPVVLQSALAF